MTNEYDWPRLVSLTGPQVSNLPQQFICPISDTVLTLSVDETRIVPEGHDPAPVEWSTLWQEISEPHFGRAHPGIESVASKAVNSTDAM